ncbi:Histidine kinase-, DNA gyrase B-, and HSP90-like ATPase [Zhouia amylolytica]|uniref:histidine kinase n=2 Tax=Zhouia amylolytica TaxID=376730 RepID=W2UKA9_9FLAO|nr:HAMP domain-containing sensor histidine kinase [Zhouia amylolytica]ETN94595.1 histidine kinase [Zhouia amylolytica AD3]SFS77298.1 Histidine kinase-, DNA gyrase B-, and HSP90-like ATPase [Zhouia amylolytica]
MDYSDQKSTTRWILIAASFIITSLILWNTYIFFQRFKEEEEAKMRVWAAAYAEFIQTVDLNKDLGNLTLEVLKNNNSTPMIYLRADGKMEPRNLDSEKSKDTLYLKRKIREFEQENISIRISYKDKFMGTLYYGNSDLLRKLKYYPIALLLIFLLFGTVVYFYYKTNKMSEQNKLWAGMAKETAHQIGTPLSSLLGWTEFLKSENVDNTIISEIEKDISRLHTITERFSKIGSIPDLERHDIVDATRKSYEYLKARSSDLIEFKFKAPDQKIYALINLQLFSWTIENLVKNAIDAMKGRGLLIIEVTDDKNYVSILISDSGKGIPKQLYNKIFEPGFTTKKRGWGLGLSLVKRIIEDYHKGKVKVLNSEIDKGTTIQIILKKED